MSNEPTYRIYYGKHLDTMTNEIPTEHIISVDPINLRIEPGKPAEPKVDQLSFVLSNKDQNGVERYDDQWFENQSRGQLEGGIIPLQLFFKVVSKFTGIGYTGVLKSKSYGSWRENVSVTLTSPIELISRSKKRFLKTFNWEGCTLNRMIASGTAGWNIWPPAKDLNGDDVEFQYLEFLIEDTGNQSTDPGFQNMDLLNHFFGGDNLNVNTSEEFDDQTENSGDLNAFVKVGPNTILTTIQVQAWKSWDQGLGHRNRLWVRCYEAKNGNYTSGDKTVLERGRFFTDDEGSTLQLGQNYTLTLFEPDRGYSPEIIVDDNFFPFRRFLFGCPVVESGGYSVIQESTKDHDPLTNDPIFIGDFFNVFGVTIASLNDSLLSEVFNNPSSADLFEYSLSGKKHRFAFWPDIMLFGWLNQDPADVIVNIGSQTNNYLFVNEEGKITYQDRLLHENNLPGNLPADAFQVQVSDIDPIGDFTDDGGFDTYEVEYSDRIEINNVSSEEKRKEAVDADGVRSNPALRSTTLKFENYRTADLGVPSMNDPVPQLLFRRSPADPNFGASGFDLEDFIPTPEEQAQAIAKSWLYPVRLWSISLDLNKYPEVRLGRYFWFVMNGVNQVWFIRSVTYQENERVSMRIQNVGVWNG